MSRELAATLAPLAGRGVRRWYPMGALIFAEGDRSSEVLLITRGTVHLAVAAGRHIADVGPGEIVGEFAALDGQPRSTSAYALTDVDLVAIAALDVHDAIERTPELDLADSRAAVADRRRRTEKRSVAVGGLPVGQLAKRLTGRLDADGSRMLDVDAGELAAELAVSREQLARALDELHHRGLLALDRGRVVVLDVAALRAVSEEE